MRSKRSQRELLNKCRAERPAYSLQRRCKKRRESLYFLQRRFCFKDHFEVRTNMDSTKLLTPKDVLKQFNIPEFSQWKYRKSGELEYYRLANKVYYDAQMIQAFLERRKNVGLRVAARDA
jgi:hypothetical protein